MSTGSTVRGAPHHLAGTASSRLRTIPGTQPSRFLRPVPELTLIGVLSPLLGSDLDPVYLTGATVSIGRDEAATVQLRDPLISRQHARITRDGDAFRVEDLGSINGTFVDGVPVVTCQLHDGDTLQVGQTLFYFDRLYVRPDQELHTCPAAQPSTR
jgi:FHA domain